MFLKKELTHQISLSDAITQAQPLNQKNWQIIQTLNDLKNS
jgi:hypothetical protein